MLSETAEQRLNAIREFTEFGSGFRIAMRDLEIRGAGNLLGPEQHGHLATVGYEMYCRMIEEAMAEVQGKPDTSELETRVDLRVDAYLPDTYIRDENQRMEMYRRIGALATDADREDILDELIDRFGETPPTVASLLDVSQLRSLCNRVGICQVTYRQEALQMKIDNRFVPDPMLLLRAMRDTDSRLSVTQSEPAFMLLKSKQPSDRAMLTEGVRVMKRLVARLDELTKENQAKGK